VKRGGDPFLYATRPNSVTGKCPGTKIPCSSKTSVENTLCYEPAVIAAYCPILAMEFATANSIEARAYDRNSNWTRLEGPQGLSLYYTKTDVDSLPLVRTEVVTAPCMIPGDV
jgi:hypothetical protein